MNTTKITLTPNWNFAFIFLLPLNTSLFNIEVYFSFIDDKGAGNFELNNLISLKIWLKKEFKQF